jgi:polysaccharide chain length determinant protein (PEP-CTERM system associated)
METPFMDSPFAPRSSLRDFLHVLFKHKVQILLFFFATVCTVTVGTFMMKPTYEATSQILVKIGRENLYVPTVPNSGNNPVININREEQLNSEIEILKSPSLAEEVVKALGPTTLYEGLNGEGRGFLAGLLPGSKARLSPVEQAVPKLEKDLTVEAVKKSNVIQVSYKNQDPRTAASVVNALVKLYLDRHLDVYKNPESYTFFEEQSRLLKDRLARAEDGLKAFKEQHDLSSLQEQRTLLLKEASGLRTAVNQTESRITETRNRIGELRRQLASVPKTIPQGEEVDHNPYLISTLQARLVELQLKEKDLLNKYTEQSRLVRSVKEEIAMVRTKLEEQEKKRYGKSSSGVNVTYQRLEEELFQNEAELQALVAKQQTQSAQVAGYQEQLEKLNRLEVRLNQLEREVDVDRQNYRLYLTKFEESRISNAMDSEKIANVSLIEPARAPLKPVSPRVLLNLALGIFLGAFGGLGLAFFTEYLDDSIEKPEQAETALGIPVLASVPEMKR